jgi:hypothetical protein
MRFSTSGFFHESGPQVFHWGHFNFFANLRRYLRMNDTGNKLFSGVNDNGEKFIAVVFFSDKHSFANISANF